MFFYYSRNFLLFRCFVPSLSIYLSNTIDSIYNSRCISIRSLTTMIYLFNHFPPSHSHHHQATKPANNCPTIHRYVFWKDWKLLYLQRRERESVTKMNKHTYGMGFSLSKWAIAFIDMAHQMIQCVSQLLSCISLFSLILLLFYGDENVCVCLCGAVILQKHGTQLKCK